MVTCIVQKILFFSLSICTCLIAHRALGQGEKDRNQKEIVAAILKDFPPLCGRNQDGTPEGFTINILEQVASRCGLKVKYQQMENWTASMDAVHTDKANLIPGIGISPERIAKFLFSEKKESVPSDSRQDRQGARGNPQAQATEKRKSSIRFQ